MIAVTVSEMRALRQMRHDGFSMALMCARFARHSRDSIVEMIDASYRDQDDLEATKRVNQVLAYQGAQWPLVNGKPRGSHHHSPMFT